MPLIADERTSLRAHLDHHRATLAWKCDGLDDEQLRRQASPPSTLSLLALVRHMAEVERTWFRKTAAAERDLPNVWSHADDYQTAYDASASTRAEAFTAWQAEIEHSRRIEAATPSLDAIFHNPRTHSDVNLRMIMLHLIHEYARHNGHADLLRESLDGTTGA
ncbi:DinB family protein [Actinocorallia lasiicapitis]